MLWCITLWLVYIPGGYYSYSRYYELKSKNITGEFGLSQAFVLNFEYYLTLKQTWLAFGQSPFSCVPVVCGDWGWGGGGQSGWLGCLMAAGLVTLGACSP